MIQSVYKIVIAAAALNVAATLALSVNTENIQVARAFNDFDLEVREPAFDILQTREFDDEFDLDARDPRFGKGFKGFLKKFRKGGSAPPSEGGESRREIDDFDLKARDFDDEFELEARKIPIFDKPRPSAKKPPHRPGSSPVKPFKFPKIPSFLRKGGSHPPSASSEGGGESRREINDFDFEARDFDDEFELEARDPRFGKGFKGIFKKFRKGGSPPSPEGGESRREIDDFDLEARDFDNEFELEARDPRFGKGFKGIFKKFRKGGSPPPSEGGESRREIDDFDLEARDLDDEFELEARNPRFGKGFKGIFKKFRKGGSPPPSEGGESRREIDDLDLEARDFDDEFELEARDPRFGKGFKGLFKKFRKGGSPPSSEGGESRREIDDLDLEARDPRFGKGFKGLFKKFRKGGSAPSSEGGESRREFDGFDHGPEARDFDEIEELE